MLAHLSPDRRDEAETAAPGRLIVLFYDQVADNLHTAISAIARNDIQERCNAVNAAIELLGDMLQCFSLDADDEIVINLEQIHTFLIARLPQVNFHNDAKFAAEAIRLLRPIRDAWAVADKVEREAAEKVHPVAFGTAGKARPKLKLVRPSL